MFSKQHLTNTTDLSHYETKYRLIKKVRPDDSKSFDEENSSHEDNVFASDDEKSISCTKKEINKKWQWKGQTQYEMQKQIFPTKPSSLEDIHRNDFQNNTIITLKKNFMYTEDLGYNWHKGWNIPNIKVEIAEKFINSIKYTTNLIVEVKAVKSVDRTSEPTGAKEIELKGVKIQKMINGIALFSGLKFGETSHINKGSKFHIVISISMQQDLSNSTDRSVALISFSSPPIFVDARKATRDSKEKKMMKQFIKYFHPFPPSALSKIYIKKTKTSSDETQAEIIDHGIVGFCDYLTASNIKNKIKHPIFLLAKFMAAIKLFYNPNYFKEKSGSKLHEEVLMALQNILLAIENNPKSDSSELEKNSKDNCLFIVIEETRSIDPFYLNKIVYEHLGPLRHESLKIIFNQSVIPPNFTQLPAIELEKAYISLYPQLMNVGSSEKKLDAHCDPLARGKDNTPPKLDIKTEISRTTSQSRPMNLNLIAQPENYLLYTPNRQIPRPVNLLSEENYGLNLPSMEFLMNNNYNSHHNNNNGAQNSNAFSAWIFNRVYNSLNNN